MSGSSTKAGVLSSVLGLLVFGGCATRRQTPPAAPLALPVVKLPVTLPIAPSGKTLFVPEQMILVESVPAGAIIVVAGRPVGKAPLRLAVPATVQGFFLNDVEIRARFVAATEDGSRAPVRHSPASAGRRRKLAPTIAWVRFAPFKAAVSSTVS